MNCCPIVLETPCSEGHLLQLHKRTHPHHLTHCIHLLSCCAVDARINNRISPGGGLVIAAERMFTSLQDIMQLASQGLDQAAQMRAGKLQFTTGQVADSLSEYLQRSVLLWAWPCCPLLLLEAAYMQLCQAISLFAQV